MKKRVEKNLPEQADIRGDGKIPIISIEAENLAEATCKAVILCKDYGARVETPKQRSGMTLGYDADMTIRVNSPDSEPKVFLPGIHDDARGIMQYIFEVTHGIHNHWKKNEQHPEWWGYTYNERFAPQLPSVFSRIKSDFKEKGRMSGRDYQFGIWIAGEDIIPEQEDPPCFQRGQLRFLQDKNGETVMNYQTDWRSRDLYKAWNENNIAQVELMKLCAAKVSNMLEIPIKLGAYIDHASSLHLYGLYVDRDGIKEQIDTIEKELFEDFPLYDIKRFGSKKEVDVARKVLMGALEIDIGKYGMPLSDFFQYVGEEAKGPEYLKKLVAAQVDAEANGHGLNQSSTKLKELGYNLETYNYPSEWDSWPKSWDAKPNPSNLARVLK